MSKAEEIIKALNLEKHPKEGGYFREVYRSDELLFASDLPGRYWGGRRFSTSIYFLLTKGEISPIHRLLSDETWHFYDGSPVTLLLLHPDGKSETVTLGSDVLKGELPQFTIKRKTWFGAQIVDNGDYALMGMTVAPAFDYHDFKMADRDILLENYPHEEAMILALTHDLPPDPRPVTRETAAFKAARNPDGKE